MQEGEHTQWGLLAPWRRWGTDDGDAGAGRAGGLWPDKRLLEAWWGFTRWSSEYVWESMWVCRVLDRMTAVSEHKAPPRPLATPPVQLRALRRSDQRTRGPLWLVTMDGTQLQAAPFFPCDKERRRVCTGRCINYMSTLHFDAGSILALPAYAQTLAPLRSEASWCSDTVCRKPPSSASRHGLAAGRSRFAGDRSHLLSSSLIPLSHAATRLHRVRPRRCVTSWPSRECACSRRTRTPARPSSRSSLLLLLVVDILNVLFNLLHLEHF